MDNEKVFAMPFPKVYDCLVAKAERKGRTQGEVDFLITWLTGWDEAGIRSAYENAMPYGDFFRQAPAPNPARVNIRGRICGIRVEEIEDDTMREIRYLDKFVDDLAKGKTLDKIIGKL